jgi:23S rRNA G2445 N2-methylase RlmL
MDLVVTTVPGLEDIVIQEALEKLTLLGTVPRFGNVGGRVLLNLPGDEAERVLRLRSIEHVIELVGAFEIGTNRGGLEEIYEGVRRLEVPLGSTFRVTCERVGKHEFTSIDVQRVAGQALVDKYQRKVDLENPETIVRVDVAGGLCMVGIQRTKTSLRIRYPRAFQHRSALNPVIAYAMLRIAGVKEEDRVLDPFCGGGTIVIEAAQVWENLDLLGIDISPKSIEGAWRNAEAAGVREKVRFLVGDARRLERFLPAGYVADKVVSNLPFGIRSGRLGAIPKIYEEFLRSLKPFLGENSRVCLLTTQARLTKDIGASLGYTIVSEREILYGGLTAWIILLHK